MKASLVDILVKLGFNHTRDAITVVPPDSFEKLDDKLVMKAVDEYQMHFTAVPPLDAETKFEIINRILELKHGMIIDEVKEIDNKGEGYDLEEMPAGF